MDEDRRVGAAQVLRCAELDQPFVARGSVVDVLESWRRLAAEARHPFYRAAAAYLEALLAD